MTHVPVCDCGEDMNVFSVSRLLAPSEWTFVYDCPVCSNYEDIEIPRGPEDFTDEEWLKVFDWIATEVWLRWLNGV